jgi:hypothetical protein
VDDQESEVCGEDSLQALNLALAFLRLRLQDLCEKGYVYRYPKSREVFDIDACFGPTIGHTDPADVRRREDGRFTLRAPCPNCAQPGSLVFLSCTACRTIILACAEEGSVFPEPLDLSVQATWTCDPDRSHVTRCPTCAIPVEFRFATGDEIQALGFRPGQYHQ